MDTNILLIIAVIAGVAAIVVVLRKHGTDVKVAVQSAAEDLKDHVSGAVSTAQSRIQNVTVAAVNRVAPQTAEAAGERQIDKPLSPAVAPSAAPTATSAPPQTSDPAKDDGSVQQAAQAPAPAVQYVPNPNSNTPDWRRWSDTYVPGGYAVRYGLMPDPVDIANAVPMASARKVVDERVPIMIMYGPDDWIAPSELAAHRQALLDREQALAQADKPWIGMGTLVRVEDLTDDDKKWLYAVSMNFPANDLFRRVLAGNQAAITTAQAFGREHYLDIDLNTYTPNATLAAEVTRVRQESTK